jgi:excisionase family DNA binding protein
MKRNLDFQKPYISLEEASEYLSLSRSTLYQYTSKRIIPHYKIGRKLLFKVSELNKFIESHRVVSKSELESEVITQILIDKISK